MRRPENTDRIYVDTRNSAPSIVQSFSSIPEQHTGKPLRDLLVNAANTGIGVAAAIGGAKATTGSMRFTKPTGPELVTKTVPKAGYERLQKELDATGGRILEQVVADGGLNALSEKPKAYWHYLGGVQTQKSLKNLGIKYDLGEAHAQGEVLYSDIGAYAHENTADFSAVSRAISTARTQRKAIGKSGLDPNVLQENQFIISAYTAKPDTPNAQRPGREHARLRYVLNPVSKENIIAAYSGDSNTGSFRQGSVSGKKEIPYADAWAMAKQTGRTVESILAENQTRIAPQVKAPLFGTGDTSTLQPSIREAINSKRGYNEIIVRPQIGDFYIQDTRPEDGALPARLQNQMKRLEQAYKVTHGGSLDPFAKVSMLMPNSFNPGTR